MTTPTTKPDINKMDFEEVTYNIVLNIDAPSGPTGVHGGGNNNNNNNKKTAPKEATEGASNSNNKSGRPTTNSIRIGRATTRQSTQQHQAWQGYYQQLQQQ